MKKLTNVVFAAYAVTAVGAAALLYLMRGIKEKHFGAHNNNV